MEQQAHRCAIDDEVVVVDEQAVVTCVAQQVEAEETASVDFEGGDQKGRTLLDIIDVLHVERPRLFFQIDDLAGLAIVGELDACEKGGMRHYGLTDGFEQTCGIERSIEQIEVRKVITYFSDVAHAFGVDAILHFGQREGLFHIEKEV